MLEEGRIPLPPETVVDVAPPAPEDRPQQRRSNDNHAVPPREAISLVDDLVMALRFFSRLPVGAAPHGRPSLNRIARALPFASLVIGIGPALLLAALAFIGLPPLVAAAIAVGAMIVVSGAMEEDGLADAADGLFGGTTRERRLEILKDSRHGTYGVSALALFLIIRVGALAALVAVHPLAGAAAWLAASVLARSAALWLTVALPPARAEGASAAAGRTGQTSFGIGIGFAAAITFILAGPPTGLVPVLLALALAALIAWLWARLCNRLVGGQTGDLIGALQALIEAAALAAFLVS
jgi:adenosylcobinamide-GDP ribazoletransferase